MGTEVQSGIRQLTGVPYFLIILKKSFLPLNLFSLVNADAVGIVFAVLSPEEPVPVHDGGNHRCQQAHEYKNDIDALVNNAGLKADEGYDHCNLATRCHAKSDNKCILPAQSHHPGREPATDDLGDDRNKGKDNKEKSNLRCDCLDIRKDPERDKEDGGKEIRCKML